MRNDKIKNEIYEIKKWEEKFKRKDLKYEEGKNKYDFQQHETIRSFGESIYSSKVNIHEAEINQTNLSENMVKFNNKSRSKTKNGKDKKWNNLDSVSALYEGWKLTLNAFRNGIFPIKETQGKGRPLDLGTQLKILTLKQMLQRLPIVLAQVKAGNTPENLLNKIRQIIYFLYRVKEITKNVYNN